MTEFHTPDTHEFQAGARKHFSYLVEEFGFHVSESWPDLTGPFAVCFACGAVFVNIVGISYGMSLEVTLGRRGYPGASDTGFSLYTLMELRDRSLLLPRYYDKHGQLVDMEFFANALKRCAQDFLSGDFGALPEVLLHERARHTAARERSDRLSFDHITAKAAEAFRAERFDRTVELLQSREAELSPAQVTMLRLARKRK